MRHFSDYARACLTLGYTTRLRPSLHRLWFSERGRTTHETGMPSRSQANLHGMGSQCSVGLEAGSWKVNMPTGELQSTPEEDSFARSLAPVAVDSFASFRGVGLGRCALSTVASNKATVRDRISVEVSSFTPTKRQLSWWTSEQEEKRNQAQAFEKFITQ